MALSEPGEPRSEEADAEAIGGAEADDAGATLLETLERVETEMLGVQARLQGTEGTAAGVVRFGAPDGFGVGFLAPRLARLAERHPRLSVQLVPQPRAAFRSPAARPTSP